MCIPFLLMSVLGSKSSFCHIFCILFQSAFISGAGIFVTTVVVGVVSFISTVTLTTRPFIRDVLFYLGAVAWTFLTLYKENITLDESIGNFHYHVHVNSSFHL